MHKTLVALTLAGACGMALCAEQARADVVYDFTTTSYGNSGTAPPAAGLKLAAQFDLSNAVVQSGSFNLVTPIGNQGSNSPPPYTGNVSDFSSLGFDVVPGYLPLSGYEYFTPASAPASLSVSLTFDSAGAIVNSSVQFLTTDISGVLSGTSGLASGFLSSDNGGCSLGPDATCYVSGYWSGSFAANAVPEPATFALIGAGLLGLAAVKRRAI